MLTRSLGYSLILICGLSLSVIADEREPDVRVLQPGVKITEIVKHPEIVTPTGIDVDPAGNLWVIASHTHFPPEDYQGPKLDEVVIFSPDGQRTLFHNATHHTMDLELGADNWVYLIERSRLLRVRDTNADQVADESEDLITMKTEAVYPHNGMAGLAWDLNGDLLFCLGENFSEAWTMTGRDGTQLQGSSEGGIFRVKPDGSGLTRIARGMWNPFGLAVRTNGELFAVDNDPGELPPCRLLQIVEGGDYGFQRQYGSEAQHPFVCWNGELRGTLPMVHPVGEAPCGVAAFGRGVLAPSWGEHHIAFYPLEAKGAGYTTKPVQLVKGSRYFRPACIARNKAEDREKYVSWYLTDWVDGRYNVHGYGRVWKLEINLKEASWLGELEIAPRSEAALLAERYRAAGKEISIEELLTGSQSEAPYLAQAALVGFSKRMHEINLEQLEEMDSVSQLTCLVALRMADQRDNSPIQPGDWIPFYLKQSDPEIQFELLRWIADLDLKDYKSEVAEIGRAADVPFKVFEAAVATINTLNGQPEIGLRNEELLLERLQEGTTSPRIQAYALRMLPAPVKTAEEEQGSVVRAKFPKGLSITLLKSLLEKGDRELSLEVISTLGSNPDLGEELLLQIIQDPQTSPDLKSEAVVALSPLVEKHRELYLELVRESHQSIREEALRALRGSEISAEEATVLKDVASEFPVSGDLVEILLSAEQLQQHRPAETETELWMARLEKVEGEPDLEAGRRLFHHPRLASCTSCHRHAGKGNTVGPDLSSVNGRKEKAWLLESILQPSREMSPSIGQH
ncbi:MAG: hypothetical protein R3C11_16705 [Planctomycetaceae bacterium]